MVSLKVFALLLLAFAVLAKAKIGKKLAKKEVIDQRRGVVCSHWEFQCRSGQCIQIKWLCDGQQDCFDGTDETTPLCVPDCSGLNQFKCANGNCIPAQDKCDQEDDCGDYSDEANCLF